MNWQKWPWLCVYIGAIDIVASHMISRIPSPPSHHIMVIRDGNVANFVSRPPSTDKLEDLAAGRGASSAAWLVPAAALGPLLRRLLKPPAPQNKACAVTITISSDRPRAGGRDRMQRDLGAIDIVASHMISRIPSSPIA